jgi:hypothetical protein
LKKKGTRTKYLHDIITKDKKGQTTTARGGKNKKLYFEGKAKNKGGKNWHIPSNGWFETIVLNEHRNILPHSSVVTPLVKEKSWR